MATSEARTSKCVTCAKYTPMWGGTFDRPPQYGGRFQCSACGEDPENVRRKHFNVGGHFTTLQRD